ALQFVFGERDYNALSCRSKNNHERSTRPRKFSEKISAEITSENAKYDVVANYSKWKKVVS
ncbi:hypothetical protein, partial [Salinivibrio socompensis]|uniref:hypothetical protein n=1 Tax=Salinivibrio socompensis TaxID=1510206 RepID=UPI00055AE3D6